jgi:4-hydroxy-tetrahydrodipicolinate synthase
MTSFKGVMTPALTPMEADGAIAHDAYAAHCRRMLEQGVHFVTPFGTTGEALSFSTGERMEALDRLIDAGLPADRLMPGTGFCSITDTVEVTRHAVGLGCAGVMTLPPFFYTQATEDGLAAYFDELIDRVGSAKLKICLYHIPQNTGIGFSPALAARLNEAHPDVVVAIKDSAGDWTNTQALLDQAPGLAVFPGSEAFLAKGMSAGAAGCISATCNVNAPMIRAVYEMGAGSEGSAPEREMQRIRTAIQAAGLIPAMKWMLARALGEPRMGRIRAPLLPLDDARGAALLAELGAEFDPLN